MGAAAFCHHGVSIENVCVRCLRLPRPAPLPAPNPRDTEISTLRDALDCRTGTCGHCPICYRRQVEGLQEHVDALTLARSQAEAERDTLRDALAEAERTAISYLSTSLRIEAERDALTHTLTTTRTALAALAESNRLSPVYQAIGEIVADAIEQSERYGRDPTRPRASIFKTTDKIATALRDRLTGTIPTPPATPALLDAIGLLIQEAKHHHGGKGAPLDGPGRLPLGLTRALAEVERLSGTIPTTTGEGETPAVCIGRTFGNESDAFPCDLPECPACKPRRGEPDAK
jgi:hypothetical protein